jgi:hypothetical protein
VHDVGKRRDEDLGRLDLGPIGDRGALLGRHQPPARESLCLLLVVAGATLVPG